MKHVGLDVNLKYMLLLKCCCQSELHRYYRVKTLDIDISADKHIFGSDASM